MQREQLLVNHWLYVSKVCLLCSPYYPNEGYVGL